MLILRENRVTAKSILHSGAEIHILRQDISHRAYAWTSIYLGCWRSCLKIIKEFVSRRAYIFVFNLDISRRDTDTVYMRC